MTKWQVLGVATAALLTAGPAAAQAQQPWSRPAPIRSPSGPKPIGSPPAAPAYKPPPVYNGQSPRPKTPFGDSVFVPEPKPHRTR